MDTSETFEENKFDDVIISKDLPSSSINNYSYGELFNLNKAYNNQLSKTIEFLIISKLPLIIPKNDMKILNNLLKENYNYLLQIIHSSLYNLEFDNLYNISLTILNNLSQCDFKSIKIYQKLQKLKFMELKFHNLRNNGDRNDYLKADKLLDDMENIQKEKILENNITLIDKTTLLLYKAMTKFLLEDISSAEEYALYALEILENQKKGWEWGSDKISDILEFLVEIYDLKKDFNSVLSLYEKLYYLNAGKFGINSPQAMKYKIKKENFEYKLENDYQIYFRGTQNNKSKNFNLNDSYDYYNDDSVNKGVNIINRLNISVAKGTTDTFSFKIPITKNIEPLIISFYSVDDDYDFEDDKYSPDLFLKNFYLDKNRLFEYYGINESDPQSNKFLYLDTTINELLSGIKIKNNNIIIENPLVLDALIN